MKLYTEESIKTIYLQGWYDGSIGMNNTDRQEDAISYITPIELPSEISDNVLFEQATVAMEEIYGSGCSEEIDAYFRGLKWMQKQYNK